MCTNIFTKKEAYTILKISSNTLDRLLLSGELEHFVVGSRVRISEEQLDSYLQSTQKKPNGGENKDAL